MHHDQEYMFMDDTVAAGGIETQHGAEGKPLGPLGYGHVKPHEHSCAARCRPVSKVFDYYIPIFHAHESNITSNHESFPRGVSGGRGGGEEGSEIVF